MLWQKEDLYGEITCDFERHIDYRRDPLLVVTVVTCSLTTKVNMQEVIKAESDKERMRANLLRAVSHDLRTPLTTIYSSSSALLDNYNYIVNELGVGYRMCERDE